MRTYLISELHRLTLCVAFMAATCLAAHAQIPGGKLKIGVLSDFSGPFADQVGHGSYVGAQMAAEDFAAESGGLGVEVVFADHQNKPDVGLAIARRWIDEDGVSAIVDLANSGVGLAVNALMRDRNRAMLASATATSDLTGKFCQPTTVQWALDTWALGNAVGRTITQDGRVVLVFHQLRICVGQGAAARRERGYRQIGGRGPRISLASPRGV
jgi:branched-chain amino acid transport system substrate-binding protein